MGCALQPLNHQAPKTWTLVTDTSPSWMNCIHLSKGTVSPIQYLVMQMGWNLRYLYLHLLNPKHMYQCFLFRFLGSRWLFFTQELFAVCIHCATIGWELGVWHVQSAWTWTHMVHLTGCFLLSPWFSGGSTPTSPESRQSSSCWPGVSTAVSWPGPARATRGILPSQSGRLVPSALSISPFSSCLSNTFWPLALIFNLSFKGQPGAQRAGAAVLRAD